ncbi:MAG TPA: maleylpyruvate isomerase family mycothiol-dependent enzyme [Frankiaceae bacterium]|jgi:uncharacterized protein (TIGR03083 family)|nr:maleylpyruvate isomerase family mycothiol-dependent enzyme [Frankiaceae bacterium]
MTADLTAVTDRSLTDRTIEALRAEHDALADIVRELSDAELSGPSGASEWTAAQVLSHLGSGAEIALAGYQATFDATPPPPDEFNQQVWDRWNAMAPADQASGFLEHDEALVAALEALPSEQRESLVIDLGFLPDPLPLGPVLAMRLNEAAQHGWDVRVGLDPAAVIGESTATVLAEHFAGGLGFLLGFTGKADALASPAVINLRDAGYALHVQDRVQLVSGPGEATATFTGPLESAVRLFGGRLTPQYTPDAVEVSGNLTLDDLRRVFPGY